MTIDTFDIKTVKDIQEHTIWY